MNFQGTSLSTLWFSQPLQLLQADNLASQMLTPSLPPSGSTLTFLVAALPSPLTACSEPALVYPQSAATRNVARDNSQIDYYQQCNLAQMIAMMKLELTKYLMANSSTLGENASNHTCFSLVP